MCTITIGIDLGNKAACILLAGCNRPRYFQVFECRITDIAERRTILRGRSCGIEGKCMALAVESAREGMAFCACHVVFIYDDIIRVKINGTVSGAIVHIRGKGVPVRLRVNGVGLCPCAAREQGEHHEKE